MDAKRNVFLLIILTTGVSVLSLNELNNCDTSDGIVFINQPRNSDVCIGTSAEVDCSFEGVEILPSWLINSKSYTSSNLPPNHYYNGRVLSIDNVFLEQNNASYQCVFVLYVDQSICQLRSRIGRLNVLTTSTCLQSRGPTNITRAEGEWNVFIPCPLSGFILPVWKINNITYELYQLPEPYQPAYGGIYIELILRDMNGTSFQCFISTESQCLVEASSIGVLTVIPSSDGPVHWPIVRNNNLYLNHQNMIFGEQNITLSWKSSNLDCNTYEIASRSECGLSSEVDYTWDASSLSFVIPNSMIEMTADITIQSVNENNLICQKMKENIQLHFSGITMEKRIPQSRRTDIVFEFQNVINSTFYLAFPKNSIVEQDCFCPVLFLDNECYNMESCFCFSDSTFGGSDIKVCSQAEGTYSVVIQNLTDNINTGCIHLFHGFYCDSGFLPPYRIYTHVFKIDRVLPEPPEVNVDIAQGMICFRSVKVEGISLDAFEVSIHDVTGGQVFGMTLSSTANCTSVDTSVFQPNECAPFLVSVKAINSYGFSDTNVTIRPQVSASNVCACFTKNVDVNVTIKSAMDSKLEIRVDCHQHIYHSSNFDIEIRINENTPHMTTMSCTLMDLSETIVTFTGLDCTTVYNVSAYWIPRQDMISSHTECKLTEPMLKDITLHCKGYISDSVIIVIISSVGAFIIILLLFLCITMIICCVCRCRRSKKYLQHINNNEGSDIDISKTSINTKKKVD